MYTFSEYGDNDSCDDIGHNHNDNGNDDDRANYTDNCDSYNDIDDNNDEIDGDDNDWIWSTKITQQPDIDFVYIYTVVYIVYIYSIVPYYMYTLDQVLYEYM